MRYLFLILLFLSCKDTPKNNNGDTGTNGGGGGVIKPPPDEVVIPVEKDYVLTWQDRRPIGMVMLASYEDPYIPGKYNWMLGGQRSFSKQALMDHAETSIKNLKSINAQGVITWDVELQEQPHPFSYIGDPVRLPQAIDTLADEYFKKFTDSGFKIGICIRPDSIVYVDGWARHYTAFNPYRVLFNKVEYAYNRWGCRLFYVDSNIGLGQIPGTDNSTGYGGKISYLIFKNLLKAFPDCLIIPEHYENEYLKYTAPLNKHNGPHLLPEGFQVLDIADNKWNDWQLIESVKAGSILMGRVWYASPELEIINRIYKNAY